LPYPLITLKKLFFSCNALILSNANMANVIEEKDLSSERLLDVIFEMMEHPVQNEHKERSLKDICYPDAAKRLAQEAVTLGQ